MKRRATRRRVTERISPHTGGAGWRYHHVAMCKHTHVSAWQGIGVSVLTFIARANIHSNGRAGARNVHCVWRRKELAVKLAKFGPNLKHQTSRGFHIWKRDDANVNVNVNHQRVSIRSRLSSTHSTLLANPPTHQDPGRNEWNIDLNL